MRKKYFEQQTLSEKKTETDPFLDGLPGNQLSEDLEGYQNSLESNTEIQVSIWASEK